MDSPRSRFLLRALRPNGADHDDPTFREALAQAEVDPDLRHWLAREQAVDRAFAGRLRELRAPVELRAQILHGLTVSRQRPVQRPWKLIAASLAAAASLTLAIYTMLPKARPAPAFDLIVAAAVRESAQPPAPTFSSNSAPEIRAWLEKSAAPIPGELPGQLAAQQPVGAGVANWQGVQCSRVALQVPDFDNGNAGSNVVHLYTLHQTSCASTGVGRTPVIVSRQQATVATWRDTKNYYILVARASPERVRSLLGPEARIARADEPIPTIVALLTGLPVRVL